MHVAITILRCFAGSMVNVVGRRDASPRVPTGGPQHYYRYPGYCWLLQHHVFIAVSAHTRLRLQDLALRCGCDGGGVHMYCTYIDTFTSQWRVPTLPKRELCIQSTATWPSLDQELAGRRPSWLRFGLPGLDVWSGSRWKQSFPVVTHKEKGAY